MSLGQSLAIGASVGIFGPGGSFLYPALVNQIIPSGSTNRFLGVAAFPPGAAAHLVISNINHRSLTVDGSGWDFASALPSYAL
jgi:hypothetical protein